MIPRGAGPIQATDGTPGAGLDFARIFEDFQPRIRRYLVRLVGEPEAEDVTQMVFLKISQALKDFRGEAALSTWIYRIAANTAADWMRSTAFKQAIQQVPLDAPSGEERAVQADWRHARPPVADQMLIRREMNRCIRQVVEELPEHDREVIVLSEFEGLTNTDIADILDVSLATVKIRLHRARGRLKQALDAGCTLYHDERQGLACDQKGSV